MIEQEIAIAILLSATYVCYLDCVINIFCIAYAKSETLIYQDKSDKSRNIFKYLNSALNITASMHGVSKRAWSGSIGL